MSLRKNIIKWLLAVSLANFALLGEWANLIAPYIEGKHAERPYFSFGSLSGVLLSIAIVAVFFRTLDYCKEHTQYRFIRGLILSTYLLAAVFPLNALRIVSSISSTIPLISFDYYRSNFPPNLIILLVILFTVSLLFYVFLRPERGLACVQKIGWSLIPFLALIVFKLTHILYKTAQRTGTAKEFVGDGGHTVVDSKPRIIWILFDAFDYRLAFDERPSWLKLPTWDRFRRESVDPQNAQSPADYTSRSIPSLFTGMHFQDQPDHQGRHLLMYPEGSNERVAFSEIPNVFTEAKAKRLLTGVVGWYLPYCFDLRTELDHCVYHSRTRFDYSGKPMNAAFQVIGRNFSLFGHQTIHQNAYRFALEQSLRAINTEELDLVFLHQPIPHEPFIYDAERGSLVVKHPRPEQGYFENLALSDQMLESLLSAVDHSKRASNTFVIITSDHPYKEHPDCPTTPTRRVPLLIRTPTKVGATITGKFETIHTKKIISLIQDGQLQDAADIKNWIENFKTN